MFFTPLLALIQIKVCIRKTKTQNFENKIQFFEWALTVALSITIFKKLK